MPEDIASFALGSLCLITGTWLVHRSLGRIGQRLGIAPFTLGLAPALPLLALSLTAVSQGQAQIALAACIGGTIANLGLVLGLTALTRPFAVRTPLARPQIYSLFGAAALLWFLTGDRTLSREDGIVLLIAAFGAVIYMLRSIRRDTVKTIPNSASPRLLDSAIALLALGVAVIVGGAFLIVPATPELSAAWHVKMWLLSITLVAVVSSLPLGALIYTARKNANTDFAFSGSVGASVFNLLLVIGITSIANPMLLRDDIITRDIPALALFTLLLVPAMINGMRFQRHDGVYLLIAFAAYIGWQVNRAGS